MLIHEETKCMCLSLETKQQRSKPFTAVTQGGVTDYLSFFLLSEALKS